MAQGSYLNIHLVTVSHLNRIQIKDVRLLILLNQSTALCSTERKGTFRIMTRNELSEIHIKRLILESFPKFFQYFSRNGFYGPEPDVDSIHLFAEIAIKSSLKVDWS